MSRGSSGTGHYTQLVWAETDRIGCGSVYYRVTFFSSLHLFVESGYPSFGPKKMRYERQK